MEATLRKDILTETYIDVENLIYDIVWKFIRKRGGDFEELAAEANLLYVLAFDSYNESKGAFSTWIHFCVWKGLLNFIKQTRQENRYGVAFCGLDEGEGQVLGKKSCPFSLSEMLEEISEDSKTLISLVFAPPEAITKRELEKGLSPCKTRVYLKGYLYTLGWTSKQIRTSFREIREILNNKNERIRL